MQNKGGAIQKEWWSLGVGMVSSWRDIHNNIFELFWRTKSSTQVEDGNFRLSTRSLEPQPSYHHPIRNKSPRSPNLLCTYENSPETKSLRFLYMNQLSPHMTLQPFLCSTVPMFQLLWPHCAWGLPWATERTPGWHWNEVCVCVCVCEDTIVKRMT